jgi:DNA-cytosine methyltransferase
MNVLSLFDGMSCAQIALIEQGIKIDTYYASEIDKHAIGQTQFNFPNTIQLGSVVDVDVSKLKPIDILFGGSPCQSFSFAGKRKGMATKCDIEILTLEHYLELKLSGFQFEGQSYLFWEYMRVLTDIRKYNPNVLFLLENVEMGEKWEKVLTQAIGIEGLHINSALVSAQNRKRIYWTNIGIEKRGLFDEYYPGIPQPKDRGILLRDILESEVPDKYYLSEKMISYFNNRAANFNQGKVNIRDKEDKASCLTSSMASCDISDNFICIDTNGRKSTDKTGCLTAHYASGVDNYSSRPFIQETLRTGGGQSQDDKHNWDLICVASRGRNPENPKSRKSGLETEQQLEARKDGKTNCLTSVQKDNLLLTDYRIRRLTPTECAKLQSIPNWYKWNCSDTQQYRMLGNGWTIDVIKHILSFANF